MQAPDHPRLGSILLALASILIWSSLAVLGTGVSGLPPLFTVGVALCVGGLVGLIRIRDWRVPLRTFAIGLGGIFGYHALLFAAFAISPAVEANLLNYLWPLLIVLLAPLFLRGLKLSARHLGGALLGLAGTFLVLGGGRLGFDVAHLPGYLLAAAAAIVWASYSLLTKRLPAFPTGAVGGFCLASGILSLLLFRLSGGGAFVMPKPNAAEWLTLAALGLGPMGLAFYSWDAALKRGDPRVIGSLAYLTPLLSTLNLVMFGGKELGALSAIAMALIVSGAVLGSVGKRRGPSPIAPVP